MEFDKAQPAILDALTAESVAGTKAGNGTATGRSSSSSASSSSGPAGRGGGAGGRGNKCTVEREVTYPVVDTVSLW